MRARQLEPYQVTARNTALASENKIHDDTVARRFGFTGGLVPGVEVYAYMTHMPLRHWGRGWLTRGSIECRFFKPLYDGETAVVTAVEVESGLEIEVVSQGTHRATGRARLGSEAAAPPCLADFIAAVPPGMRPPATESTLAPGRWLAIAPFRVTTEYAARYLRDVGETEPLYASEGLAHPGIILRTCNWVLAQNVVLGPWVHVGSGVQNFSTAHVGDELSVRACITANYERKGHRFVDIDALILSNGTTPVARINHTAIYRPRQVAEASQNAE